jgi:amidase
MPDATAATDLLYRPVTELARMVREGEITARELVETSLARIEAVDDRVNAFTTLDGERALEAADAVGPADPRPFAGVPIGIKDLFTSLAGVPQSQGSAWANFTPEHDNNPVRRIKEAGFIPVGVTAPPEFGIVPVTESRRFGPTRNPWNLDHTPGGSSGGSGAAVAAGMVPIAHATDGGGSTRIPAACCGLVGLKPQRGRISKAPELGDSFLSIDGVVSRTVAETAALLDILAGPELGDATWAAPPAEPFAGQAARDPGRRRIAMTTVPPLEADIDPRVSAATREAADLLASLGHDVEELENPPWAIPGILDLFTMLWCGLIGMGIGFGTVLAGREPTDEDIEPLSMAIYRRGREMDAITYETAMTQLKGIARMMIGGFSAYDAVLSPVLAGRPARIGQIDTSSEDPWGTFADTARYVPFTAGANLTGQPAISLPVFQWDDGMPLAVQLFGRPAEEGVLLSLAAQVEAARPWADRRAPLD